MVNRLRYSMQTTHINNLQLISTVHKIKENLILAPIQQITPQPQPLQPQLQTRQIQPQQPLSQLMII